MISAGTKNPFRVPAEVTSSPRTARLLCTLAFSLSGLAGHLAVDVAVASAASISGRVRLDGPAPTPPIITMSADPACDKLFPQGRPSEAVVVDPAGGLANVLVYVKSGIPEDYVPPAPAASAGIDQKGCAYIPHVIGVRVGQEIAIHNSDATIHNVNARAVENTPFNEALPAQGLVLRKSFPREEVAVKLKCDIHPWMSAYIGVFAHPFFAVTAADGSFSITGLPEGEYTVRAWHESLGERTMGVEVDDEDSATLKFSFVGN